jgi:hypothetical protein
MGVRNAAVQTVFDEPVMGSQHMIIRSEMEMLVFILKESIISHGIISCLLEMHDLFCGTLIQRRVVLKRRGEDRRQKKKEPEKIEQENKRKREKEKEIEKEIEKERNGKRK